MQQLVTVSGIERMEDLKNSINRLFEQEQYEAITQSIGMHSILVEPENMLTDQDGLYHFVLNLLKKQLTRSIGASYSSWLKAFPSLLVRIDRDGALVTDASARSTLASRHAAFGAFTSLDEFYFWALDDRRLPLGQIVAYVRKTLEMHRS